MSAKKKSLTVGNDQLFEEIRSLIEETRTTVATTVNSAMTMLYWRIGKRINEEVLKGQRADYGKKILATLSQQLSQRESTVYLFRHSGMLLAGIQNASQPPAGKLDPGLRRGDERESGVTKESPG